MNDETPIETARRRRRRRDKHCCVQCGRKIEIENHHVAGRRHDPEFTVNLCRACHAQATEMLRIGDVDMRYTPNSVERVRRSLKATAVFLSTLSAALDRWGETLDGAHE